jgi:hypothetical protein
MKHGRKAPRVLTFLAAACTAVLLAGGAGLPASAGSAGPIIHLVAATDEVTATRYPHQPVLIDPGIYVAASGQAFELRVSRVDYDHPVEVVQVIRTGGTVQYRPLPSAILDGWAGLRTFIRVTIMDDAGTTTFLDRTATFCPNSYDLQRTGPAGPPEPSFPQQCGINPFTLGMPWGIDQDWAVRPFQAVPANLAPGHYQLTMSITRGYRDLFGIPDSDAVSTVGVTVVSSSGRCDASCDDGRPDNQAPPRLPEAPTQTSPDPETLPDLVSLPSFSIQAVSGANRDFLAFGANVWVSGHAPLDVQGYRRLGTDLMDAYQYFYRDGEVVGQAPVGTLEWDPEDGHEHWHFTEFVAYSLLDDTGQGVVRSHKQGFCLAPTDAINLLLPGATARPDSLGFYSVCGSETSLWVRETLPLGWGDTYFQGVPGQSFDITGVPNGTYYIAVRANPTGVLFESDTTNNLTLRKVILGGSPGARTAM